MAQLRRSNSEPEIGPHPDEIEPELAMMNEDGAGDRANTDWMDQQSTGWLAGRSSSTSSAYRSRLRRAQLGSNTAFRRHLRRCRRENNVAVPTMGDFFRQKADMDQTTSASLRVKVALFLALVLVPSIMEMEPRIQFNEQWQQDGHFSFLKRRRLALTFAGNVCAVLIRSCMAAALPFYSMLSMSHPNRFNLRVPRADGTECEVPVNLNVFFIGLLPYVMRLLAGFLRFVNDTWVAYNDHVLTIAESFNILRVLILLIHVMQLIYGIELMLLMVQGMFGFLHAVRIFLLIAGRDYEHAEQFERRKPNSKLWFIPTRATVAVYYAFKERVWDLSNSLLQ
ncbi:uncharacterized protein LOC108041557 [Drosophila rhopaloa]|uniref:Uncharacterized protein LOC108041557 n=1 Tax=Drosophila rhopaloa TaxID=1041015 RepID=A0A6P4EA69_DRORH|nr:uncharacterized protein LOC108041557 [Drosophila rhopaloa]XP_016974977.1 uncharacterized protein LOC108041557 [Drosophila rhopaloa]XP_016974978.1 uncharacterized protein LOC108041557 [Drosophila rhopaloa]